MARREMHSHFQRTRPLLFNPIPAEKLSERREQLIKEILEKKIAQKPASGLLPTVRITVAYRICAEEALRETKTSLRFHEKNFNRKAYEVYIQKMDEIAEQHAQFDEQYAFVYSLIQKKGGDNPPKDLNRQIATENAKLNNLMRTAADSEMAAIQMLDKAFNDKLLTELFISTFSQQFTHLQPKIHEQW